MRLTISEYSTIRIRLNVRSGQTSDLGQLFGRYERRKLEVAELNRSQIVIGSQEHRDPRSKPYAFTEQGVAMLSPSEALGR